MDTGQPSVTSNVMSNHLSYHHKVHYTYIGMYIQKYIHYYVPHRGEVLVGRKMYHICYQEHQLVLGVCPCRLNWRCKLTSETIPISIGGL